MQKYFILYREIINEKEKKRKTVSEKVTKRETVNGQIHYSTPVIRMPLLFLLPAVLPQFTTMVVRLNCL